jgi:protocatechuate 3,4-dioxygenase beta subunit
LLTATLYTGSSTDKTVIDTVTVTLYNTGATGAVQVPETLLGSVTYDDFIADGEKVTAGVNVDPNQDIELRGTVVDANGVGIPAAVVIISAPGMQIQEEGSTKYYMDTHTINANSAGVFDVNLNAHMVNTTGVDVTVTTADGVSATTLVKTYLPEDTDLGTGGLQSLNGDNLVFSVSMPENVVMNKTYAVTAKLTDKWGNPVKTSSTAVQFTGAGSFQLNGISTGIDKDFDSNGEALVYLRSVKDIAGPGTIEATLEAATYTAWDVDAGETAATTLGVTETTTDVVTTVWDETVFENAFSQVVQVLESEADIVTSQKVNVGTFKGYVALYAKGYEGQKMSAIVAGKWIVVESLASDFERVVRFTGAGYTITTKLYIDGEQVGDAFTTLTK